jgi:MFS family permease
MAAAGWRAYLNGRILAILFFGFSSGLPLYTLLYLTQAWMAKSGLDLKALGLFAVVTFPYTFKFLWAPFMDRYTLALGRRRGWMALTQLGLFATMGGMGMLDPKSQVGLVALCVGAVAFLSASQDVVIDAYRREVLEDEQQGLGAAVIVNAYKAAALVPSALGLVLADTLPWPVVFWIVAAFMLPGLACTLLVAEPKMYGDPPKNLQQAVVEPFREFILRDGWQKALWIVAFILLYKIGDSMATALATKFFLALGFTTRHGRQCHRAVGQPGGGHRWRRVDGQAGRQPLAVGVRRPAGGGHPRLCVAGPGRDGYHLAGRRLWLRSVRQHGLGHGRTGGVHIARHRPALHCHPIRTVFQPGRRAAHLH